MPVRGKQWATPFMGWVHFSFQLMINDLSAKNRFFAGYIVKVEEMILQSQAEFDEMFKNQLATVDPEYEDGLISFYEDEAEQHFRFSPALLYNSAFISLYSHFETSLREICAQYVNSYEGIEMPNPSQDVIKTYRNFLSRFYDFTKVDAQWSFIADCQKIRNGLIHHSGILPANKYNSILGILKKYPSISRIDNSYTFKITDKALLLKLNDLIATVLNTVLDGLEIPPTSTSLLN